MSGSAVLPRPWKQAFLVLTQRTSRAYLPDWRPTAPRWAAHPLARASAADHGRTSTRHALSVTGARSASRSCKAELAAVTDRQQTLVRRPTRSLSVVAREDELLACRADVGERGSLGREVRDAEAGHRGRRCCVADSRTRPPERLGVLPCDVCSVRSTSPTPVHVTLKCTGPHAPLTESQTSTDASSDAPRSECSMRS